MGTDTTEQMIINGVRTVIRISGTGEPLLFFHGAGTFTGFDFAKQWADEFKVLIPYHPGFGDSEVDSHITEMHDYVLHYVELLDQLGIDQVNMVGHSLGGWLAALFASEHRHRVKRLVLLSPAGLQVPEYPTADLFRIRPHELPLKLVSNPAVLETMIPKEPDVEWVVRQYRENTSLARVIWQRNYDPKLTRWLHRINMPTLIIWGKDDQIIPVQQAEVWSKKIPHADLKLLEGYGHLLLHEGTEAVSAVKAFLTT